MCFHLANFGLRRPFRCRVRLRHATGRRQTDRHWHSFHYAFPYGGRGHNDTLYYVTLSQKSATVCGRSGVCVCVLERRSSAADDAAADEGWSRSKNECLSLARFILTMSIHLAPRPSNITHSRIAANPSSKSTQKHAHFYRIRRRTAAMADTIRGSPCNFKIAVRPLDVLIFMFTVWLLKLIVVAWD